jgi:diguanylate cyclase (GGDEF)-like protein
MQPMTEFLAQATLGLQMALACLASYVAFDLSKRLGSKLTADVALYVVAACLALSTGLWSSTVLGLDAQNLPFDLGYHPVLAVGVWMAAAVFCSFGLAVGGRRGPVTSSTVWGAGLLACGIVASQVLLIHALGLSPGVIWNTHMLGAAVTLAAVGCAVALWFQAEVRARIRQGNLAWQLVPALLLGLSIVGSQALVIDAAALDGQTSSSWPGRVSSESMEMLATVGSLLLLLMLLLLSQIELRLKASLQRAKGELEKQSLRDPLTGLPNRSMFEGTLAQCVHKADATGGRLALLLINLDGFKPINESFGHRAGDRVLREIAARLRTLAQPHMVARLGSDEFLLLLPDDPSAEDASSVAARVLASTCLPCRIDGREAIVSSSIGIAKYPKHGAMSTLIAHADAAMRVAKASGGATYCFFEARMISGLREQTELLRDLRHALAHAQLELYYQPKIHAPTGEITGAEALMRWQHPNLGMISPTVFIPIAERYGLIGALGNWLIDESCRQIRAWRDGGLRMRVAINLSVHQLRQPDLVERIAHALKKHDVNPGLLTCEITESVAMDDTEGTIAIFKRLTDLGISISIDDFGTGHSSLSYLRKLPTSELKIDRSFVLDLETSEDARKVASAVINLAKSLDLKVVAEGVETEGQNKILREFGCDQLQGFLFAKPMSAKALALWAMDDVGPRTMSFRSSLFKETGPAELV